MLTTRTTFFDYIGKSFTDTDDSLHFQITKIVTPKSSSKKTQHLFYRYFDTSKFPSAPTLEQDFEHTPCSEFVKKRRPGGTLYSPEFIQWDAASTASVTPLLPLLASAPTTLGADHMQSVFSQATNVPNPNFLDEERKSTRSSRHQFKVAQAYSTFHSTFDSPIEAS